MSAYPVMLNVERLRVLVVGGGAVATRKVRGLVDAGAAPSIVSPAATDALREMVRAHGLLHHPRPYQAGDANGHQFVFAATDSADVNAEVARDARAAGALVSRADEGGASDFQVPSHLREGDVVVALSTGGASPLLGRRLTERLGAIVTPGLGRTARRLADVRMEVQARWAGDEARRRAFWFELITPAFVDHASAGRDEDVERAIAECLSQS